MTSNEGTISPTSSSLQPLAPLVPPSLSTAWLTAPHPTLPIVATCSSDKSVRIYSLTSFTLLSTFSGGHKRSVRTCAWKPGTKGESILATGSFDASVGVWKHWDTEDLNPRPEKVDVDVPDGGSPGLEGDGSDGDNREEEDEEWRFAFVLDGHDSEVKSVAWSAGGNFLATCSRDKSVWIWEEVGEDDFETIAVLQEHGGDVKCVAWHPEEELLASASYDDDIRLWKEDVDDWGCVAVLRGHTSTVWAVAWEAVSLGGVVGAAADTESKKEWVKRREQSGPRLASCSDDKSVRVWRRRPREKGPPQSRLSIIRTSSNEETWIEEAELPRKHERAIYSVAWSHRSGRIVTAGGDGKIVIYEERWKVERGLDSSAVDGNHNEDGNAVMQGVEDMIVDKTGESGTKEASALENSPNGDYTTTAQADSTLSQEAGVHEAQEATEWIVIAELEGAHGVFEINHVCWARRADRGKRGDNDEVIISTADDGFTKTWTIND